jgi:hypothetical protein
MFDRFSGVILRLFYGKKWWLVIMVQTFAAWWVGKLFYSLSASSFLGFSKINIVSVFGGAFDDPSSISASLFFIHVSWVFIIFLAIFWGRACIQLERASAISRLGMVKIFFSATLMAFIFFWGALFFNGKSNYLGGVFYEFGYLYLLMIVCLWWGGGICVIAMHAFFFRVFKIQKRGINGRC